MVPEERLELSHPCGYGILSPERLPFHHSGKPDNNNITIFLCQLTIIQADGNILRSCFGLFYGAGL